MIFLYTFLCLILFILLFIPGFVSNKYLSQNKLLQVPDLFLGFILFILIGTIFSVLFINFIPLQYLWISSYLLLLILSTIHFFISKDTFVDIFSISMFRNILIFCIVFLLTLVIRFLNPDILHTEKIMELMILTSVMDMRSIIPDDLWFHNENIKYYYFGYFVFSSVPKILLLESNVAYNFILPTVISYSAIVLIHFTKLLFDHLKIKKNFILFFIFSFIFIFFLSPVASSIEFMSHLSIGNISFYKFIDINGIDNLPKIKLFWPDDHWWWFSISRIISYNRSDFILSDYTINEFPAFSVILGDIHPHVLAIPSVLLSIYLIIFIFKNAYKNNEFNYLSIIQLTIIFLFTILINPWYLIPILWLFFLNLLFYEYYIGTKLWVFIKSIIQKCLPLLLIGIIVILFLNPSNQLKFPFISFVKVSSQMVHLIIYWSLIFSPILLFSLIKIFRNGFLKKELLQNSIVFVFFSVLLTLVSTKVFNVELFLNYVFIIISFSLIISIFIVFIKQKYENKNYLDLTIAISILSGILVVYGTEFIFIVDSFNNRMNTVFKFYFFVYLLVSIFSVYFLYKVYLSLSKKTSLIFISVFLIFIVPSIWWSISALNSRFQEHQGIRGLDGLSYLIDEEKELISFIKNNTQTEDIVLETVGRAYTKSNLISASTGRATILGWPNHEIQWRGSSTAINDLKDKIELFYQDPNNNMELVSEYNLKYLILSKSDILKNKYDENEFIKSFDLIFENKEYKFFMTK
ncbi:MAG: hypothetical protein CL775_04845 [Chloroflexi bacterium]|nr:hypothetical protein [Chloroflexota bacterium]